MAQTSKSNKHDRPLPTFTCSTRPKVEDLCQAETYILNRAKEDDHRIEQSVVVAIVVIVLWLLSLCLMVTTEAGSAIIWCFALPRVAVVELDQPTPLHAAAEVLALKDPAAVAPIIM